MDRRSRLEIYFDILMVIERGVDNPPQIMSESHLSWEAMRELLGRLLESGFITEERMENSKRYHVTDKGRNALSSRTHAKGMRIAVLAWESMHSILVGGLGVVVSQYAEALAQQGHEVHIFTRWVEGQSDSEHIKGHYYHRCKFDSGQNLLAFVKNMSESFVARLQDIERHYGKFDIIHGHDWHIVDALHQLKNEGRIIVLTFHSTEYGRNGGHFGDWWEFKEISSKEWYGGYIADYITTVSNTLKNELCRLYNIPSYKIDVVPNAINPEEFQVKVNPGRVKEKYGIHPLAPLVLFYGRLVYQKGPDLLIEAVPKSLSNRRDLKFIFAGEGEMKQDLQHRATALGIDWATRFPGWLPQQALVELLNSADIVCLPSRNEPFGRVLLEAWAAGRPVVATDVGGLKENIENFMDGVKVYTTPESIAWGINYLINNQEAMQQISQNCRQKVLKFEWANVAKQYVKTYWMARDKQAVAQHIDKVYGTASQSSLEYSDEPFVALSS